MLKKVFSFLNGTKEKTQSETNSQRQNQKLNSPAGIVAGLSKSGPVGSGPETENSAPAFAPIVARLPEDPATRAELEEAIKKWATQPVDLHQVITPQYSRVTPQYNNYVKYLEGRVAELQKLVWEWESMVSFSVEKKDV